MRRPPQPDPCTEEAIDNGCTCRMSSVNSGSIDPPEPVRDKYCPLHGWAPDPDDARDRAIDDKLTEATYGLDNDPQ